MNFVFRCTNSTVPFLFQRDTDFIGREALLRQKAEGVRRLYVHFTVQDHDPAADPWAWGHEPILRDGVYSGLVTTSAFGYSLGKLVSKGGGNW